MVGIRGTNVSIILKAKITSLAVPMAIALVLQDVVAAEVFRPRDVAMAMAAVAMATVVVLASILSKQPRLRLPLKIQCQSQHNTTLTKSAKIPIGDGMKQTMLNPQVNKKKRN
jgi:hypothetical protein